MITSKMRENANKIAFYIEQYPEKKLPELLKMLEMPAIDINSSLWAAQELGYIAEPEKDGTLKLLDFPLTWDFGAIVDDLKEAMMYSFAKLALKETDLEENQIAQWTLGYRALDVLIAVKSLLTERKLFEYEILDQQRDEKGKLQFKKGKPIMDTYIFYTLWENSEQEWGRKQFKTDPKELADKEGKAM